MKSSKTSSPSRASDEAILAEAKNIRLRDESFERALGRAIRHHCEGKEAYEMYIKLIAKHRESKEY
ncbi:MAG: hypothetical protein V1934_03730 [Methanobacteriota archaeon]